MCETIRTDKAFYARLILSSIISSMFNVMDIKLNKNLDKSKIKEYDKELLSNYVDFLNSLIDNFDLILNEVRGIQTRADSDTEIVLDKLEYFLDDNPYGYSLNKYFIISPGSTTDLNRVKKFEIHLYRHDHSGQFIIKSENGDTRNTLINLVNILKAFKNRVEYEFTIFCKDNNIK